MRIVGIYCGNGISKEAIALEGMVALEAQWMNVETYTRDTVSKSDKCFIKVGVDRFVYSIRRKDGSYLAGDEANNLIAEIAEKGYVYLEEKDMGLFDAANSKFAPVDVANELDENYNPIPLVVEIAK